MNKSISAIIQEMKHHRNSFMKKSTPYRQLNRAIKQLEKLEKIEQIVNAPIMNNQADYIRVQTIKEVLEDE